MCNQQQSHRQLQSHNSFSSTSRGFLPLLCRLSIKDVKLPKWPDSDRSSSSSSDEPTSPKVSCIGQVKKRKNINKVISCPTQHKSTAGSAKSADSNLGYTKLRKLFSGKNLLTNGVVNTTVETNTTHSCKMMIRNGSSTTSTGTRLRMPPTQRKMRSCRSDSEIVNILELDPPLPVVKKVQQCGRDDQVNLWKRRCGGAGNGISLRSLQIEQIHVPNDHHIPPTTV